MAEDDPLTGAVTHAGLPPEYRELETAVRDVAYRLTHDLHNTGEDLRDAAAFAPLAMVKFLNSLVTRVSAHPRKLVLGLVVFVLSVGLLRRAPHSRPTRSGRSRPSGSID